MQLKLRLGTLVMVLALGGAAFVTAPAAMAAQWSAPSSVTGVKLLRAVSCVNRNFCMAVGGSQAVVYRSGAWRKPKTIDSHHGINDGLVTVSCVSTEFCAAGDGTGNVFIYNGASWSSPTSATNAGLAQLSCAASEFCGAVDIAGRALFYNGSSWSAPQQIAPGTQAGVISCPLVGFCMALDIGNSAYRLSGGSWVHAGHLNTSNPQGGSEPNIPSAVSCSGNRFCAALDDFGEAFTWARGHGFSGPHTFDKNLLAGSDAVSCPQKRVCMAVDGTGVASGLNGSTWSSKQQIDPSSGGLTAVSCSSARFCAAVDTRARALIYR